MRLISTSHDSERSNRLTEHLTSLGIENQLEMTSDNDWGSSDYGTPTYKIWVKDEDQFEQAIVTAKEFFAEPDAPKYQQIQKPIRSVTPPPIETIEKKTDTLRDKRAKRVTPWSREPIGIVTLYLIIGCALLFFMTEATAPVITEKITTSLPQIPIQFSELKKEMLFDYPEAYEIIDKLINAYGLEKVQHPDELPKEGLTLLKQFENTPYWKGYYEDAVRYLRQPDTYQPSTAPMFEKIRQGEIWRLFTPTLIHYDVFHILFNMMWLSVMGRQLEQRMGRGRYILFILITGIVANVIQYLAGGPNFMGISAVLCAMLTFIWVRQKRYPWEGYQLQSSTLGFILFFLFTMLAIQLTSFYTEVAVGQSISPPIANTAHMTGLVLGLILGRLNFFSWR